MFEQARKTLKVARNAGPEAVRQAYVRLVRRYPPEHFPEKFVGLRQAYQQLTLDDDFTEEVAHLAFPLNPLILAGLMWNDHEELRPEKGVSLMDLLSGLKMEETLNALDNALEEAAREGKEGS
jgi:hypothetical protein